MTLTDLPEIQITHHARATRLRLRVEPTQIRLTVPKFCSKRQIQEFLNQSEQWMVETWQKQQVSLVQVDRTLPSELHLFNRQHALTISYKTQRHAYLFDEQSNQLWVSDRQPESYLKSFVIAYAKQYLPAYLQQISHETGLKFVQCAVRQPKTRWGSCSVKHDIMLNSALALFPEAITRYVCVHELAHTRHFDHSVRFWSEVEKHDPTFQQHRRTLKTTALPHWWYQK